MLELFTSEKERQNRSHFKHLVAIAKLDGHISREELIFLDKIGRKNHLSPDDIASLINTSDLGDLIVPKELRIKFELLYEALEMTYADGFISEDELDFCNDFAVKLGFKKEITTVIVRRIGMGLELKDPKENIYFNIKPFMLL
jgi:hypothetical protein